MKLWDKIISKLKKPHEKKEKIEYLKILIERNEKKIKELKVKLKRKMTLAEREKIEKRIVKQIEMKENRLKRIKLLEK